MTEAVLVRAPDGDEYQVRLIQALDADRMFTASRYTCSVESATTGYEVVLLFSPIAYHLLPDSRRVRLPEIARDLIAEAVRQGKAGPGAEIRVSSAGVAVVDGHAVSRLLPLSAPG